MSDLDSLYQREELLEIYKDPMNRGSIDNPTVQVHETNPMCGDEIDLYVQLKGDKITDLKYAGDACAVSIISSALVTEELIGKTVTEAKNLKKEDILAMIGIELTTSRVKCATLILEALTKALEGQNATTN